MGPINLGAINKMLTLPEGIDGFTPIGKSLPEMALGTYKGWLHKVVEQSKDFKLLKATRSHEKKNYHYISVSKAGAPFAFALCNNIYPYMAFTPISKTIYMPKTFIDIPELETHLRSIERLTLLDAKTLNERHSELQRYDNEDGIFGSVIFNDWN